MDTVNERGPECDWQEDSVHTVVGWESTRYAQARTLLPPTLHTQPSVRPTVLLNLLVPLSFYQCSIDLALLTSTFLTAPREINALKHTIQLTYTTFKLMTDEQIIIL